MRICKIGDPPFALVAGAILGTGVAAMVHYYQPDSNMPTTGTKTDLSVAFAVCAVVFVFVAQSLVAAFSFPVVTGAIGAIGSAIFPYVLFDKFAQPGQPGTRQ